MTKINAKIVADSKNEFGDRLTTMVVTMPRIILAEFNTHRMFSRNSASSRAIPFDKMVKSVQENPFIPIAWQKEHKGMQGSEYFEHPVEIQGLTASWLRARDYAIVEATRLNQMECTKQLCNRLLEPFMWHTVIVTSSEWENFFALRCPQYETTFTNKNGNLETIYFRSKKDYLYEKDSHDKSGKFERPNKLEWRKINKGAAEIHMMALAESMWDAYNESIPKELKAGEWHIPFGDTISDSQVSGFLHKDSDESFGQADYNEFRIEVATAMCARVSYTLVGEEGKEPNYDNDLKLHDRLLESGHWSPFEHIARAMTEREYTAHIRNDGLVAEVSGVVKNMGVTYDNLYLQNDALGWSGNLKGFVQYRKIFDCENIK